VRTIVSVGSVNLAKADQPGPDWIPALHVIDKVLNSGYTHVTEPEADDGRWEGEGIKNGRKMEFHADPKTGVIRFEKLETKRAVKAAYASAEFARGLFWA
jgi:Peptidase propeptide and YPEB domain